MITGTWRKKNMKKRTKLITAAVSLGALMTVGGTLAWFTDSETATNVVTTGNVNVKITEALPTEEQQEEGGFTAVENADEGITYEGIEPGTVIPKDPVIQYIGASDAYVRYKVEVSGISEDNVKFIRNGVDVTEVIMNMAGDYIYSTEIFKQGDFVTHGESVGEAVPFFTEVEFFGGNELVDLQDISITVKADAIQADNLPDVDVDGKITEADIEDAFGEGEVDSYEDNKMVFEQ